MVTLHIWDVASRFESDVFYHKTHTAIYKNIFAIREKFKNVSS